MNKYKLAVFDMDGTILDTLQDLTNSINYALERNHLPEHTLAEVRSFVGNGIRKLVERAIPEDLVQDKMESVYEDFTEHYTEHCVDCTKPYDGIVDMLKALKANGVLLAVVSNKADYAVQELCDTFFPGLFDVAVGEREGMRRKPAPDTVNYVLNQLHMTRKEAVYIGDSEVDIETAKNAGMKCISVSWGFRDEAFLYSTGASCVVSSPQVAGDMIENRKVYNKKGRRKKRNLFYNWKAIVWYELTYKLAIALAAIPFFIMVFNASIRLAGYHYLSNDNFFRYLRKPTTIGIAVFLILVIQFFLYFEMTALTGAFHASSERKKIGFSELYRVGFYHMKRVFRPTNFPVLLWVMFIMPIINLIYGFGASFIFNIPGFIMKEINKQIGLIMPALLIVFLLSLLAMRRLYCLQGLVVEKTSFWRGTKKDHRLIHGHYWKTGGMLLLWNALVAIAMVLFFGLGTVLTITITRWIGIDKALHVVTLRSVTALKYALVILYYLLMIPFNIAFICHSYNKKKYKCGEPIPKYQEAPQIGKHPKRLKAVLAFVIFLLIFNSISVLTIRANQFVLNAELFQRPVIMAHRGSSYEAPENTMAAFELAIEEMADYIELDVQMTSDGVVVVTHDTNLKRITGLNKNVWQVTYDEIKDLDAGSFFDSKYADQRIPTLAEVLELTTGKIHLNIEMKPSGHETGFEEEVIRLVREYGIEEDCMICSMKLGTLQRIKALAPEIETTYVISYAYSNFWDTPGIDSFSLNLSTTNREMIYNVKEAEKDIYVWTVNTDAGMQSALDLGVDGIITDEPLLGLSYILDHFAPDSVVNLVEDTLLDIEAEDAAEAAASMEDSN